jgi:hypothetical protein
VGKSEKDYQQGKEPFGGSTRVYSFRTIGDRRDFWDFSDNCGAAIRRDPTALSFGWRGTPGFW